MPFTQSFLLYAPITALEPSGLWGHAMAATADKGHRYYEQVVDASVDAIRQTFAALDRVRPSPGSSAEDDRRPGPAATPSE